MINYQDALNRIKSAVNGRDVNNFTTRVPKIKFNLIKNDVEIHTFELSVQASYYHYSSPRENCDEYDEVEIGFPNFKFSDEFISRYADDTNNPLDTVYGYVPIEELALEIANFCKKFKQEINNDRTNEN